MDGFKKPSGLFPLDNRAAFTSDMNAATVGADAEVPDNYIK